MSLIVEQSFNVQNILIQPVVFKLYVQVLYAQMANPKETVMHVWSHTYNSQIVSHIHLEYRKLRSPIVEQLFGT